MMISSVDVLLIYDGAEDGKVTEENA